MTFTVSTFEHTYDRTPTQRQASWEQLTDSLTRFAIHEGEKKTLKAWSPTSYKEGATRGAAGVHSLSALVLDYDNGTPIQEALECWSWRPGILHTSWSHDLSRPKFRVILPLSEPVPAENWPAVFSWAERWSSKLTNEEAIETPEDYHKATHEPTIDKACKDPGRLYYVPAVRAEDWPRYATSWHPSGGYLGTHTPWAKQLKALRDSRAAKQARRQPARVLRVPASIASRKVRERLKTLPSARLELGKALGGTVRGERVHGITCPNCGRPDVWYLIDPDSKTSASCNHQNSCGWWGSLYDLGRGHE